MVVQATEPYFVILYNAKISDSSKLELNTRIGSGDFPSCLEHALHKCIWMCFRFNGYRLIQ